MSKIYEALEQARYSMAPIEPIIPFVKTETTEKMLGLYQGIESLLPYVEKKIIQFVGSRKGEGTSTIAREFSLVLASVLEKTVLLLDADRGHPTQYLLCSVPQPQVYCLEEAIRKSEPIDKAFNRLENSNLLVCTMTKGHIPPSHVVSLNGLEKHLRERFDYVIIDSPPIAESFDSVALSRTVDGVLLVLEAEKTPVPVVQSAKERILQHGGNILGIVLNKRNYYVPGFIYRRL